MCEHFIITKIYLFVHFLCSILTKKRQNSLIAPSIIHVAICQKYVRLFSFMPTTYFVNLVPFNYEFLGKHENALVSIEM